MVFDAFSFNSIIFVINFKVRSKAKCLLFNSVDVGIHAKIQNLLKKCKIRLKKRSRLFFIRFFIIKNKIRLLGSPVRFSRYLYQPTKNAQLSLNYIRRYQSRDKNWLSIFIKFIIFRPYFIWERKIFKSNGFFFFYKICQDFIYI